MVHTFQPENNIARTKIVATVGPASSSTERLTELIKAGVDVFRLNMAHGSIEQKEDIVQKIRAAAKSAEFCIGVLVDLAGPKIRLGQLSSDPLTLENGQLVHFVPGDVSTQPDELVCAYEPLIREVSVGDSIVLADGIARLTVIAKTDDRVTCEVVDGGTIRSRQGVNLPGTHLSVPALGDEDIENAKWAASIEADFVSLSFVRNADEINQLKSILAEAGSHAKVVAKIEKREALDNLDEIVVATDAVMVARGDLGVEIDIEKTPVAQKRIIKTCEIHRKPVIVATQMLESMHTSKQPTRAEVSDVANAILDGADACMLSGETAIGDYPVEAVSMMNRIMLSVEQEYAGQPPRRPHADTVPDCATSEAIIFAAAVVARRIKAQLVVIASSDPEIALAKSKQRDYVQTFCITDSLTAGRQMTLLWGVVPFVIKTVFDHSMLGPFIDDVAKRGKYAQAGDSVVTVTDTDMESGVHDTIVVSKIG